MVNTELDNTELGRKDCIYISVNTELDNTELGRKDCIYISV
jgi:hypothetical protein